MWFLQVLFQLHSPSLHSSSVSFALGDPGRLGAAHWLVTRLYWGADISYLFTCVFVQQAILRCTLFIDRSSDSLSVSQVSVRRSLLDFTLCCIARPPLHTSCSLNVPLNWLRLVVISESASMAPPLRRVDSYWKKQLHPVSCQKKPLPPSAVVLLDVLGCCFTYNPAWFS